jgi:hypothetical protein
MVGGRTDMNDGAAAQPNRLCNISKYMIDKQQQQTKTRA